MRRYGLRDDQWERIGELLPGREGYVGVTAIDNRLFVEAVLYRYRAGIPWRPEARLSSNSRSGRIRALPSARRGSGNRKTGARASSKTTHRSQGGPTGGSSECAPERCCATPPENHGRHADRDRASPLPIGP